MPHWNFDDPKYADNYVLINSGGLGLFSAVAPLILAKKFTFANYVNFSHTYGQPIIHGKTESENTVDRKRMANDIAGAAQNKVIVTGLNDEVDIKTFTMSNSEHVFTGLISIVDKDVSNLILGSESMAVPHNLMWEQHVRMKNIFRDRIEVYRDYIELVMNESIIPRLVKLGYLPSGLEFKYAKRIEMSDEDRIRLFQNLTTSWEMDPETIEQEFGVKVKRQLNVMTGVPGATSSCGSSGEYGHRRLTDEEYYRRYGHARETTNFSSGEGVTGPAPLSNIVAWRKPDDDQDRHKNEVAVLLSLFHGFVLSMVGQDREWDSLEELMKARADIAIQRALSGFGIDYDDAIELIRNADNLDNEQSVQRNIIMAAVSNLVGFLGCRRVSNG